MKLKAAEQRRDREKTTKILDGTKRGFSLCLMSSGEDDRWGDLSLLNSIVSLMKSVALRTIICSLSLVVENGSG